MFRSVGHMSSGESLCSSVVMNFSVSVVAKPKKSISCCCCPLMVDKAMIKVRRLWIVSMVDFLF